MVASLTVNNLVSTLNPQQYIVVKVSIKIFMKIHVSVSTSIMSYRLSIILNIQPTAKHPLIVITNYVNSL